VRTNDTASTGKVTTALANVQGEVVVQFVPFAAHWINELVKYNLTCAGFAPDGSPFTLLTKLPCRNWWSSMVRKYRPVHGLVAFPAKRDQIGLCVISMGASPSHVVNVQIPERSALLTTPTVAFQDGTTQRRIKPRRRSNSRSFLRSGIIHLAQS
jgi:hypothetical protein